MRGVPDHSARGNRNYNLAANGIDDTPTEGTKR